ncbi:hypothetical protein SAY86_007587 [Trapa natans]|uniref:Homeobox domain-containing protein n=1 Tax=Trapa natans TaxID=22666 RepID=A0AAN7R2A5_TRANT|nr:hypothetical protein SAY86_007587 [Trapa natans]
MAEGFEQCLHVPQQSRMDKLRVAAGVGAGGELATASFHGLLPHYDRSLLTSHLLSSSAAVAAADRGIQSYNFCPLAAAEEDGVCRPPYSLSSVAKEEERGFRSLIPPASSFSRTNHLHQQLSDMDPLSQVAVNPSCSASIHGIASTTPFLHPPQNLRNYSTLSLSLSSNNINNRPDDSLIVPLELNLHRYGSTAAGGFPIPTAAPSGGLLPSTVVSRCSGPFDVYSSILKGSWFLKPTQQLLEEFCDVGRQKPFEKMAEADSIMVVNASAMECYLMAEDGGSSITSTRGEASEIHRRKSGLVSLLEEVCRRYKQYYEQMQDVVASFEYLTGFGNSAPCTGLALKAMPKHFRGLKNAITDQLQMGKDDPGNPIRDGGQSRFGIADGAPYGQRPFSSPGYIGHRQPVWRPQKGLPERAVAVLKAWLFEHFLYPYPTDADKIMLAKQAGLSRNQVSCLFFSELSAFELATDCIIRINMPPKNHEQVSNWFINARVRLWKPMVEEIHMLETQQAQKASDPQKRKDANTNSSLSRLIDHQLPLASDAPSTSTQSIHQTPSNKRTQSDLPKLPTRNFNERRHNLSCDLPSHLTDRGSVVEGVGGLNSSVLVAWSSPEQQGDEFTNTLSGQCNPAVRPMFGWERPGFHF